MAIGEWLSSLTSTEAWFFYASVLGGGLFVLRMVLQFIGFGDMEGDFDADMASTDVDIADFDHGADASFGLLSFQGISAFFMMFGLVGLMMLRDFESTTAVAILVATVAGVATMYLIRFLFQAMSKLQSSGTLDMGNAVGTEGSAYLTIPAGGIGKVQVTIQDRMQVFDAVSDKPFEIKTGERVKVIEVRGDRLVVERVV